MVPRACVCGKQCCQFFVLLWGLLCSVIWAIDHCLLSHQLQLYSRHTVPCRREVLRDIPKMVCLGGALRDCPPKVLFPRSTAGQLRN